MLTILEALLALWHHFWDQFRHLGVTFGAFWMHFSFQKTNSGAKVGPRGATTKIKAPVWGPFGGNFSCVFVFLMQTSVYLTHVTFFSIFGVHGVLLVMGSYAIRTRICSPNTLFTFCIFSQKRFPEEFKIGRFGSHFS